MKLLQYINSNLEIIIFFILVSILSYLILKRSWEGFFAQQNGINRLDAIIYINLENRSDRKDLLMGELTKLNTDMNKVHKVSGVYMPKNGHKGCIQSHILALNMIKMNTWERVLILEDDAELDMEPEVINNLINKSLDELDGNHPDWNVIMLATANKMLDKQNGNSNGKNTTIPMQIYSADGKILPLNIEKLNSATTSSAYIVKKSYAETILNLFTTCNNNMSANKMTSDGFEHWALDQKWAELQNKDKWFCIDKDPIKQRAIWSTIQSNASTM